MAERTVALKFNSSKNPGTSAQNFSYIESLFSHFQLQNFSVNFRLFGTVTMQKSPHRLLYKCLANFIPHKFLTSEGQVHFWTQIPANMNGHEFEEVNFQNGIYSHLLVQSIHQDINDPVIKATTFNGLRDWNTNWSLVDAS